LAFFCVFGGRILGDDGAAPVHSSGSLPIWLNVVAGMFMAIFEGKLGDARFIEFAQSFCDHAVALGLKVLENPSNA
jgi:C4-dicarboxylate transporter